MENITVSLDFTDFPPAHTCEGGNSSPKITIEGLEASSLAIMVFNPSIRDVISYCAWLIWDMPAQKVIPAGVPQGKIIASPISALQGTNDAGIVGYSGPCPKPGETHRYLFRVYALDDFLQIPGGLGKAALRSAMHDHVVQYGETEAFASGGAAPQPAATRVQKVR
jgi:Raf kinase inhibitor-like YbhB/YbcL family protein